MPWLLLLACTIGDAGPASPGSPAAEAVADVAAIQAEAAEIEKLAHQLEQDVDRLRRGAIEGGDRVAGAAALQAQVEQLETKNAVLQEHIATLEHDVRAGAGDQRLTAEPSEDEQ